MAKKQPNFKKPPRPPSLSYTTQTPAAEPSVTQKTDGLPGFISPPSLPSHDYADHGSSTTHRASSQTEVGRKSRVSWDPFARYWSGQNSFPDYGTSKGSMMPSFKGRVMGILDSVNPVNYLNGRPPSQTESLPAQKRNGEAPPSRSAKRSRTDNHDKVEVVSLDGESDIIQGARSSMSPANCRKHDQGSQSVRSYADGELKGSEIPEYRSASKFTGGNKRSRHKKNAAVQPHGHAGQDMRFIDAQRPPFKKQLVSRRENPRDDIEDEVNLASETQRPTSRRDRKGNVKSASFTTYSFAVVPSSDGEADEDDEDDYDTIARLPNSRVSGGTARSTRASRPASATNGVKRSPGSPDHLQGSHSAKRRSQPSSRGDIPRTSFVPAAVKVTRGRTRALKVDRAVCTTCYIYPAENGMPQDALGATNEPAFLCRTSDETQVFQVNNDEGEVVDELEWMVPKVSKMQRITFNEQSRVVQVSKSTDSTTNLSTGGLLTIQFTTLEEARVYVATYADLARNVNFSNKYRGDVDELIGRAMKTVGTRNSQAPPDVSAALPTDMQLLQHRQQAARIGTRKAPGQVELSQATTGHYDQTKKQAMRTRMRSDGLSKDGSVMHQPVSQGRTPKTPAEEQELRHLLENEGSNDEVYVPRRSTRSRGSPSRVDEREITFQRPKSLRSFGSRARSPTPPERWTDKNPKWQEEHKWRIPLIYERATINDADVYRLDEGQFLNDEIISFYARYLHKQLEKRDEPTAKRVYVFNSFFFEKLKTRQYDGVKSWTAKIDLFSFDYVIVPINQSAHWYLAIICNPGALLPRGDPQADAQDAPGVRKGDGVDARMEAEAAVNPDKKSPAITDTHMEGQADGSIASDVEEVRAPRSGRKPKTARRGHRPRKYDPKEPRVITLDSLGANHTNVATTLRNYLKAEIENRKGVDIELPSPFGTTAKDIPFQKNFTDCGVYLLGYLEEFMKDPHAFTRGILQQEGRDWNVNAPKLRNKIRDLIFELQKTYQAEDERSRRERRDKRVSAKQGRSKSQTPAGERQPSVVASELPQRRVHASASPAAEPHAAPGAVSSPLTSGRLTVVEHPASANSEGHQQLQRSTQPSHSTLRSGSRSPSRDLSSPTRNDKVVRRPAQGQARSSISPPPLRRRLAGKSESQTSDHEATNVNDSMVVNLNDSVEIKDQQGPSTPRVALPVLKSVEDASEGNGQTPRQPQSSTLRDSSRKSVPPSWTPRAFVKPLPSSSPSGPASMGKNADRKGSPATKLPSKARSSARDETRSPWFTSASLKPPSPGTSARPTATPRYVAVNSSDGEGSYKHHKQEETVSHRNHKTHGSKGNRGESRAGTPIDLTSE